MPITLDLEVLAAAEYVYQTRLSKPYTDTVPREEGPGHELQPYITIDGKRLHRPIHGLAHTMRTLMYSHLLFPLLQESARKKQISEGVYQPLAYLTPLDLKKINIAQLFFVAGRESEASYGSAYYRYHKAGADQFAHYARKNLTHLFSEEEIVLYARCIEDRGEDRHNWSPQANIIGLCHMIDLMRCKGPVEVFLGYSRDAESEVVSGIMPSLIYEFGHVHAMEILKYTRDLFAATGEGVPYIDSSEWPHLGANLGKVAGAQELFGNCNAGGLFKVNGEIKEVADGVFKADGQEADAKRSAQAGFSVDGCYAALLEVEPPEWYHQPSEHPENVSLDIVGREEPAQASPILDLMERGELTESVVIPMRQVDQPRRKGCLESLFGFFFTPVPRGNTEEPTASSDYGHNG